MEDFKMTYDFQNRNEMLDKLRSYATSPDDDNIRIKNEIYELLLHCPELLYALHEEELGRELFNSDGSLNIDENGDPLGEWDRYFGINGNIKPYLFIPETQTTVKHYVSYQTSFKELVRYNNAEKIMQVTFTIFVNGKDAMDELTGIPRHDLIASIIREKFAWIGIEISTPVPIVDEESITDRGYVVRTLQFEITLPNSIVKTEKGTHFYKNKRW